MKIGVHGKEFTRQSAPFIQHIFEILARHHAELFVSSRFAGFLKQPAFKNFKWETYHPTDSLSALELVISIGGDGTLLESVSHIGKTQTPVLGINTGRLGFLATISRDETEHALEQVLNKSFTLDKRAVLRLDTEQGIFGNLNFARNDISDVSETMIGLTVRLWGLTGVSTKLPDRGKIKGPPQLRE